MNSNAFSLQDLEVFRALAETLSFSKAAVVVAVSQSAVSQSVTRLEERLGRPLLNRTTRRVELTPDGRILSGYASAMSRIADETRRRFASGGRRTVRVGMVEDFALTGLHRALGLLMKEERQLAVTFVTGLSTRLRRSLEAGELDLAVTKRLPGTMSGRLLGSRPLVWSGDLPLEDGGGEVPLVLYPEPSETREVVLAALRGAGRTWAVVAESEGLTGVAAAVKAELGVAAFTRGLLPPGVGERTAGPLPALGALDYVVEAAPRPRDALLDAFVTVVERIAVELLGRP